MGLKKARAALNDAMALREGAVFRELVVKQWFAAQYLIQEWRNALKAWEAKETFERAYQDDRMSVRTFDTGFDKQYQKKFDSIDLVGTNRLRPDSSYVGTFPRGKQLDHLTAASSKEETTWYHAKRGLDSSAFARPSNFATREMKYRNGLHDLSASLVNHEVSIFDQIHNKDEGAFFAFLPLPEMEDQALLYALVRMAKAMRNDAPEFYAKVRNLRAEITRVKLAAEYDMAIGYSAMPVDKPLPGQPKYKLRYGLGDKTAPVEGEVADAKLLLADKELTMKKVDKGTYEARQQSGIRYKSILEKAARRAVGNKTEIVIAIRHHAGPFPMYAQRAGDLLKVITINTGAVVETTKTISKLGVMT